MTVPELAYLPLQGEELVFKKKGLSEGPRRRSSALNPDTVTCMGLCCARLSCSWCAKLGILLALLQGYFIWGSLSRPIWIPISTDKACEVCKDAAGCSKPASHYAPLRDRAACESHCEDMDGCQAVDWYNATGWCNLYTQACETPSADWDGASSFQIAVGCNMHNGSSGILIAGRCHLGIEVPSAWSIARAEVPLMLSSPYSWSCSLTVALLYTYLMSPWFRGAVKPAVNPLCAPVRGVVRWLWAGGIWRRLMLVPLVVLAWVAFTRWEFGSSPIPKSVDQAEQLPLSQLAWLGGSAFVAFLAICPMCRAWICAAFLTVVGWIMSLFTSLAACAFSACFDTAAAGLGALALGGGSAVAAAADGTVVAEGAVAAEGLGAVEAGTGAEGAAMADGAAAGGAAAEGAMAADAAVAAEAAAAAEGVAAAAVFCVVL